MRRIFNQNTKKPIHRRSFLKFSGAALFTALGTMLSYYFIGNEYEKPVVEKVEVSVPIMGALILPYLSWKYPISLYDVNGMWLYTNRGLGTTNIPLRINCAPEITELTLV